MRSINQLSERQMLLTPMGQNDNQAEVMGGPRSNRSFESTAVQRRLWQLEALRGFAALYVLLHHLSSNYHIVRALSVSLPNPL